MFGCGSATTCRTQVPGDSLAKRPNEGGLVDPLVQVPQRCETERCEQKQGLSQHAGNRGIERGLPDKLALRDEPDTADRGKKPARSNRSQARLGFVEIAFKRT